MGSGCGPQESSDRCGLILSHPPDLCTNGHDLPTQASSRDSDGHQIGPWLLSGSQSVPWATSARPPLNTRSLGLLHPGQECTGDVGWEGTGLGSSAKGSLVV